jgi:hypothetical protein
MSNGFGAVEQQSDFGRDLRLELTSAFSRLPPVRRADLKGQLRGRVLPKLVGS